MGSGKVGYGKWEGRVYSRKWEGRACTVFSGV